jgi:hypothetical protein
MQAIYRIIDFKLNEYKNSVIGDVESDYGYNLYQLEKHLGILKQENIYLSIEGERVFKELHRTYLNKGDLLAKVNNLELYSSKYTDLIELGILKKTTTTSQPFDLIEYQIKDKKEFTKIARDTIRQFLCLIYWIERKNFILNYASKIERENKILSVQIISTIEKIRNKKPIRIEIKTEDVKGNKQSPTIIEPRYLSFYSSKFRYLRNKDLNNLLDKMELLSKLAIRLGILSDTTDGKLLLDFFTTERMNHNRKIIWKGKPFELREFTQKIANTGICEEIKPKSYEKWRVVQSCFHVKIRGRKMGPIHDLKSISGAKQTKSDNLDNIIMFVDKIMEAARE